MENLTGKSFGRLKVIELKEIKGKGHFYYLCQCQCGNFRTIDGHSLIKGKTKSCGCLRKELLRERNKTHNLSNSRLYGIYRHIKERCYNPNCKDYKYYGSCGIVMCEEWAINFMNFYNWAMADKYGYDLDLLKSYNVDCRLVLRNLVVPEIGKNIFEQVCKESL